MDVRTSLWKYAALTALLGLFCACGGGADPTGSVNGGTGDVFVDLPGGGPDADAENTPPPSIPPPPVLLNLETFQKAFLVLGQNTFTDGDPDQGTPSPHAGAKADSLVHPFGLSGNDDEIWVADFGNNRVLRYDRPITEKGPDAALALGQAGMTTDTGGLSVGDLYLPCDVVRADDRIIVSDAGNNRVLIWTPIPARTGEWSQVVIGQPDFISNEGATSRTGMLGPGGLCVANGKLFVVDSGNNRVLIYNRIPTENGAPADVVIGQPDFDTRTANTTRTGFDGPTDVWSDGYKLAVSDGINNRVLLWAPVPTTNHALAKYVLGHDDFTSRYEPGLLERDGGLPFGGRHVIAYPAGLDSNGTQLVVSDGQFNRVLIWNTWPEGSGAAALPDVVLGQSTWVNHYPNDESQEMYSDGVSIPPPRVKTLNSPRWVHINGTELFVADTWNHRVLVFK